MKIRLINHPRDPDRICAAAALSCYSREPSAAIFENITDENARKAIAKIVGMGHLSVIEHANFTFSIEGVSRALTHQLVRHRIASYSQQSQRYVSMDRAEYIVPPSIAADPESLRRYEALMDVIWKEYAKLCENAPKEDARYVLPNACNTNITVTMNARELWHFFTLRCCRRAQWEIRKMAWYMLEAARKTSPILFENAGPACVRGPCPEGEYSCGKPVRKGETPSDLDEEVLVGKPSQE
ncbi:MAG TPA: FAD-dependent thymidylate synthase [Euryarchaeota archaeon]|nr:FAD-dependent thymidylate synthase [Euryarchaeota archaeon]